MSKMMTKDSSGTQNERLMVFVRVRPMENSIDGTRAVTVMNSKTLAFMEPSEKSDLGEGTRGSRASLHSTSRSSRRNNQAHHYSNHMTNGMGSTNTSTTSGGPSFYTNSPQKYPPSSVVEGKYYEFDGVFDESAQQDEVYEATAAPLVRSVLEGFYATVFAYGATGSGKTHTMVGTPGNPGVMARAVADIFRLCQSGATDYGTKAEVYLSYLEIYNEQIRDLLTPNPGVNLELREDREQVHVAGLSEVRATSANEVLSLLQKGNKARTMEATAANTTSSRSHAVLMVTVRQISMQTGEILDGKLYLIDLAGSERASHTKNSGIRLREGGHINRSLLALGNCITALASGAGEKYINYRDSKLTRLLKAALGGPSKTAMIAHISASFLQRDETRNTLLYAQRARTISNRVKKFVYPGHHTETTMMIQELRNEVKRLQSKLRSNSTVKNGDEIPTNMNDDEAAAVLMQNNIANGRSAYYGGVGGIVGNNQVYNNDMEDYKSHNKRLDRPEVKALKAEITGLFDEEFRLRNHLLKLDGAMLQSALDCEILRLMVLDWENLKTGNNSDGEGSSEESEMMLGNTTEIQGVMSELKQVRTEQDRLLQLRSDVENKLVLVREKIVQMEEEANTYLPELQREVLSLLCKLQQDQLSKVSIEIEAELKRRGSLLLRCLRQKALGEAIIHRQRHFLNAISGSSSAYPPHHHHKTSGGGDESALPLTANHHRSDRGDTFLPPLTNGNNNGKGTPSNYHHNQLHHQPNHQNNIVASNSPTSSDRMSATPPEHQAVLKNHNKDPRSSAAIIMSNSRRGSPTHYGGNGGGGGGGGGGGAGYYHQYFPPLGSATPSAIPRTTKYSDFRQQKTRGMVNGNGGNNMMNGGGGGTGSNQPPPYSHSRPMLRMKSSSEENLEERAASPTRYFAERGGGGGGGGEVYGGGGMRPLRKQSGHSQSSQNIPYPLSY